jgi:allantoin racemase
MTRKILYINPIATSGAIGATESLEYLASETREDVELWAVNLPRGPLHLRYRYYQALVLPDLLNLIREAERRAFDAAVIGCFYDTGLQDAREIARQLVVTAPCEASTLIASTLCDRFSILVGCQKATAQIRQNLQHYGMDRRVASFRSLDLAVREFHQSESQTTQRLRDLAHQAVEVDGAEAIILGCTATYGFWRELQRELGVPVIDPMIAAFKHAEFAAELARRYDWAQSKTGAYASPPPAEIDEWRLNDQYDLHRISSWLDGASQARLGSHNVTSTS